jgi:NADH dehydrogenase
VPRIRFELGEVEGVDFDRRVVAVRSADGQRIELDYDHVVLALGSTSSTHGIPGAAEHSLPFKTIEDATAVRMRSITALEIAANATDDAERRRYLTFVIVGGGFTGVEAGGELLGFLRSAVRSYPNIEANLLRVVLVAGASHLLEGLPDSISSGARTMLRERGVQCVFDDRVASVDAGGLTLSSGTRFESKTILWSAGVGVPPLLATLDLERSKHGAIVVRSDFSVPGRDGVWAIGDCAQVPKLGGGFYAQTAQHAVREGVALAENLRATMRGKKTKPFVYKTIGMMASIGRREGLADIGPLKMQGLPAWLLWRGYYLSQLPGLGLKARVAFDWALSLPFPKDIASIR